ncbi:DNA adenine methylase [Spiroplasma endosymbiont of Ammophila pubescens]|uniref:DNA adenine methylase n=1 Tax=Spiroplasma endosymbiont of Ammophila pubescens TaxID=3066315 RepID=UPI0032B1E87F
MKFISPLSWSGGKAKHFDKIKALLPAKFDKFIDLFCGGASVGLNVLDQQLCNKVVFNDLHTSLIEFWQYGIYLIELDYLKKLAYPNSKTINELKEKMFDDYCLNFGEEFLIKNALTFNGEEWGTWTDKRLQQNFNVNKLLRIQNVRKLLFDLKNNIEFYNLDYKNIINKYYMNKNIVWYLDPPYYYNKEKVYKHSKMNFYELKDNILKIKGKWILSIDNSEFIKDLFKEFNINEFQWVYSSTNWHNKKPKLGQELIITNFR